MAQLIFIKKKVLYNRYYEHLSDFETACVKFFRGIRKYRNELETLLTDNFQVFGTWKLKSDGYNGLKTDENSFYKNKEQCSEFKNDSARFVSENLFHQIEFLENEKTKYLDWFKNNQKKSSN